jgi:hypothetical protein
MPTVDLGKLIERGILHLVGGTPGCGCVDCVAFHEHAATEAKRLQERIDRDILDAILGRTPTP